jgi:hypothetical protein
MKTGWKAFTETWSAAASGFLALKWIPPPIIEDEHCFNSDGAYLDGSFIGAGAALNMKSGCLKSYSFYPCTSSSEAEKEGLFMATELALEANLRNSGY